MKNNSPYKPVNVPSLQELLTTIDKYFDCRLSDNEEKELIHWLTILPYSHPEIEEAKAVIGLRIPADHKKDISKKQNIFSSSTFSNLRKYLYPSFGVAAAVAIIFSLFTIFYSPVSSSTFIAYSGGVRITDEDDVMTLLRNQMIEFDTQQKGQLYKVKEELSEIEPVNDDIDAISLLFR